MIYCDKIIMEIVSQNWLTITMTLAALKGVAKITPWAWDDSLVSLLFGVFKNIRRQHGLADKKES